MRAPVCAVMFTILVSVPPGILCAARKDRMIDHIVRFFSFIGNSMPNFFVSLLLIWFFSIHLNVFPVLAREGSTGSLVLPTLTLGIAMSSKYIRQIRAAVLEELGMEAKKQPEE